MATVRLMKKADLPEIGRLEKECFSNPWSMREIEEAFLTPAYHCFAAEEAASSEEPARIVGYALFFSGGEEADLASIAVATEARRRGIGRELLSAVLESAKSIGVQEIFLEVREHNTGAIALYEQAGFLKVGVRKEYYENPVEDALLMRRSFTENETQRSKEC